MQNKYVVVREIESGVVVKKLGPMSERKAEKVLSGIYRQMGDEFEATIEEEKGGLK